MQWFREAIVVIVVDVGITIAIDETPSIPSSDYVSHCRWVFMNAQITVELDSVLISKRN